VRLGGLGQLKNSMTLGIEPATFRLVAWYVNYSALAARVSDLGCVIGNPQVSMVSRINTQAHHDRLLPNPYLVIVHVHHPISFESMLDTASLSNLSANQSCREFKNS
jgi:hypothetical protein